MTMLGAVALGTQNRVQGSYGEQLVAALAAASGLNCYKPSIDLGFDLALESSVGDMIRLQVKSTSATLTVIDGSLRYPLEVEAFDRLREESTVHNYLIVVEVRANQHEWVASMDWGFVLRRRAHFLSLRGDGPSPNASTVTVSLPLVNMVTPAVLRSLTEGGV